MAFQGTRHRIDGIEHGAEIDAERLVGMKKILVDAHDWFPYTGCMTTMLSWMHHDVKIPMGTNAKIIALL
jgi:hypothetical protein